MRRSWRRPLLDNNLMTVVDDFPDTGRRKPDPELVVFDLFRYTDQHDDDSAGSALAVRSLW